MGRAARWLRGFLGMKTENNSPSAGEGGRSKLKKRCSLRGSTLKPYIIDEKEGDGSKHAIVVAAATAAAADAAVTAAHAAAAAVKLRATAARGAGRRRAAVEIQAAFRGLLARKALRALKGLVKLQALVRGYLVRKRTAATLACMQALVRAQSEIRSERARLSLSISSSSGKDPKLSTGFWPRRSTTGKGEFMRERLSTSMESCVSEIFDQSPKTARMERLKQRSFMFPGRVNIGGEDDLRWRWYARDEVAISTAESTPRYNNGGLSRRDWPNYMASTHSFMAKKRCDSTPRHRPEPRSKGRLSLSEVVASSRNMGNPCEWKTQRWSLSEPREGFRK